MKFVSKSTTFTVLLSFLLASNNSNIVSGTNPANVPSTGDTAFKVLDDPSKNPPTAGTAPSTASLATQQGAEQVIEVNPKILTPEQEKSVFAAPNVSGETQSLQATGQTIKQEATPGTTAQTQPQPQPQPQPQVQAQPQTQPQTQPQAQPQVQPQAQPQIQPSTGSSQQVAQSAGTGKSQSLVAKAISDLLNAEKQSQGKEPIASDTSTPSKEPVTQTPAKTETAPPAKSAEAIPSAPALASPATAPVPLHPRTQPGKILPTYLSKTQRANIDKYKEVIKSNLDNSFNKQIPTINPLDDRFLRVISWNVRGEEVGGEASTRLGNAITLLAQDQFRPSVLMLQQVPIIKNELQPNFLDGIKLVLGLNHVVYCQDANVQTGLLIASKHPLIKDDTFKYLLNETEDNCFALRSAVELSLGKDYEPVKVNFANVNFSQSVVSLSSQIGELVPKLKPLSSSPLLLAGTTNKVGWTLSASLLEPVSLHSAFSTLSWTSPTMTNWNGQALDHAYVTNPLGVSLLGIYEGASLDSDHLPLIIDFELTGIAKKKTATPAAPAAPSTTGGTSKSTSSTTSTPTAAPATSPATTTPPAAKTEKATTEKVPAQKTKSYFWKNAASSNASNATVLPILIIGAIMLLN